MIKQRTLYKTVVATGVGLHGGKKVTLAMHPAPINHGLVFHRKDLSPVVNMEVNPYFVCDTRLCSGLEREGVKIRTIEHIMSALSGFGIDNLDIEVDAPEIPIFDGSAATFTLLLQSAGVIEQDAPKKFLKLIKEVEYREEDKWAKFSPYNGFKLDFAIQFNHPAIERTANSTSFDFSVGHYAQEIARARTFGFMQDVEFMQSHGLALGGSLGNAIVMDEKRILNDEGLRYDDEFARHKLLDAIGDLYICGHPLLAAYSAYKSGHALNNQLLRALYEDESAWEFAEFTDKNKAPSSIAQMYPPIIYTEEEVLL